MATPTPRLSEVESVTILSGQSLSSGINMNGRILVGIFMPAAWTAAGLSFQASPDGVTYMDMWDETAEITAVAAASRYVGVNPQKFFGVNWIKVRSATAGAGVAQGADRVLSMMTGVPDVS